MRLHIRLWSKPLTMSTIPWPKRDVGIVQINALAHGMMSMGGNVYGAAAADEERFEVLDRLWELGQTNWDTAHMYGDAEELIGKWLAKHPERRPEIFLATKFGVQLVPHTAIRGDPEFVKEQLATSLKRLQTDYIDLYYQHRPDPKTPIEVTVKVLAEFIKEGKIRQYGLSDSSVTTIRRAQKIHPMAAIQIEINPFARAALAPGGLVETASELGITVFAYAPNAAGMAVGRFKSPDELPQGDIRRGLPRYQPEVFPHALELSETFASIGRALSPAAPYTASQVCLAWVAAQASNVIPVPGSSSVKRTEENCRAVNVFGQLGEEHLALIRAALKKTDETVAKASRRQPGAGELSFVETPEYVP
ncbi:Aldo/keto reductase [Clavulina sp. PMI_390]|nr:Aldo/keto reductase [Clavulina sp. PMI_390]